MDNDHDEEGHLIRILKSFSTAMLITEDPKIGIHSQPMGVAQVDDDGTVFFSTDINSEKVKAIRSNPKCAIAFQGKTQFASLTGRAAITQDRALVDALWSEGWRVWFSGGKDDPRLCLIAVQPDRGEYWDSAGAKGVGMMFKAAKAYVSGERPAQREEEHSKVKL